MPSELLQQVRVLDPVSEFDRTADVLIQDGMVRAVAERLGQMPADTRVRDGQGLILGPGLVDLYSHSGEPGFESRETLDSLMQSAIAGGFTRLTLLPDTDPALDNPATLEWFRSQLKLRQSTPHSPTAPLPRLSHWSALTLATKGEQMVELAELAAAGVVGFADGQAIQNAGLVRRSLEYAQPFGQPIALYCCDRSLAGNGVVRDGLEAMRLGLPSVPVSAETAAIAALLESVVLYNTPVHIMRVSTARGVELIRQAKAQGLPVTASATWLHFVLDITAIHSYDPSLRLDPPLGNPEDRQALVQGLKEGVLDAIAIDHTPYTYEEKTVPFAEAPAGAIGLELALPILWQTLVASAELSALQLWRSLSTNPAVCLHQDPAVLQAGQSAELVLFDPQQSWEVTVQTLKSQATNTPWFGEKLRGRVLQTWH